MPQQSVHKSQTIAAANQPDVAPGNAVAGSKDGDPYTSIGRCTCKIAADKRAVTVDTGLRLSRCFGISAGFSTGSPRDDDAATAERTLAEQVAWIKPWSYAV